VDGPLPKTSQEYVDALKKLDADPRCLSCAQEDWFVVGEGAMQLRAGKKPMHIAVWVKCGFVRLHSLGHVNLMRPPNLDASS
jgi:hypothetical protein